MSPDQPGEQRGPVIAIGGAEDKRHELAILARLVELAGGARASLAVIPTASRLPDTGDIYVEVFRKLGVGSATCLPIRKRADTQSAASLRALNEADAIFITGGNQLRLSSILGGSPVARAIRHRSSAGTVVAGTSAGAAILSEHMIAYGQEGATPRAGMVSVVPGLGLINNLIIDQHFRQRDRLGRLLTALACNPFVVGVGLDEDTAIIVDALGWAEVIGNNAVTIVDASAISHNEMGNVRQGDPISLFGLRLHILVAGGRFNLHTRRTDAPRDDEAGSVDDRLRQADHDVDGMRAEAEDEPETVVVESILDSENLP